MQQEIKIDGFLLGNEVVMIAPDGTSLSGKLEKVSGSGNNCHYGIKVCMKNYEDSMRHLATSYDRNMGKRKFYALLQGLEPPIYIHVYRTTTGSLPDIKVIAFDIRVMSGGVRENTLAWTVWDEDPRSKRWGPRFQYYSFVLSSGKRKPNEDRDSLERRIDARRGKLQDWLNDFLYALDPPLCMCGCGENVKWSKQKGDWNLFIFNHHVKRLWKDPEFLEKIRQSRERPEYREKLRASNLKVWQDPEKRKKMSEAMKRRWQDPEFRAKMAQTQKEKWKRPGYREKMSKIRSEAMKRKWQDPVFRAKMLKIRQSPEYRSKISETRIEDWKNPEYREKMAEAHGRSASSERVE